MGWLELVPLLKRLLPLLGRIAPMMETYVAARAAHVQDNSVAMEKFAGELKGDFAITSQNHAELKRTLADHTEHLMILADDIKLLRVNTTQNGARLEEVESQIAGITRLLRASIGLGVVLLIAVVMLIALTIHRG